ncbi:MAG: thiamine pyrophosphate-binding protein [Desulfobacter sp.]|nr:thiamine pyrophosphate-binding protein [Desulfobacter sp.]WDP87453.1 MAG: thiamine pyrophosphate-binding protein [Desulfobacter sp.]
MDEEKKTHKGWGLIKEAFLTAGVEYIFGLPGESISPIQYAVEDTAIEIITTRHEQASAFMAEAYARMTGKPGVVLVTFGPGFTNTLSAMVNAQLTNAPMVLIAGAHGTKSQDRLGLQDMRQRPIIESIVKKTLVCRKPERIFEYVDMAFRFATQGRPGPVFLELPIDVLDGDVDLDKVNKVSTKTLSRPVDKNDARKMVEMIQAAQQPVILAGSGAYYSGAGDELVEFVEQTGIPAFTLKMGRGLIPDTHPLCFGSSIPTLPGCAGMATTQADLVILLGNRLCLYNVFGAFYNPDAKIIQVDIEPEEIGRNKSIDLPVFADVKALLEECIQIVNAAGLDLRLCFSGWTQRLTATDQEMKSEAQKEMIKDSSLINSGVLADKVNDFMDREDDIIVADGGDAQTWVAGARICKSPMNIIDSSLYGCLGVGLPYGNAAKLINPRRRVLVYTGDGSMGFNFMEIETSIRKGLPLVVVIDNNQKWGMTSNSMQMKFEHHIPGTVEIGNPPYHKAVEALGGKGILVERVEDILPALETAFASAMTTCINVMTDPDVIGPGSKALAMAEML